MNVIGLSKEDELHLLFFGICKNKSTHKTLLNNFLEHVKVNFILVSSKQINWKIPMIWASKIILQRIVTQI